MSGMDEQRQKINERMAKPAPLVSDAEVDAALEFLNRASDLAGRKQPIPRTLMRCILEEAAMERVGMRSRTVPNGERGGAA